MLKAIISQYSSVSYSQCHTVRVYSLKCVFEECAGQPYHPAVFLMAILLVYWNYEYMRGSLSVTVMLYHKSCHYYCCFFCLHSHLYLPASYLFKLMAGANQSLNKSKQPTGCTLTFTRFIWEQ